MLLPAGQTYSNQADTVFPAAARTATTTSGVFVADTSKLVCHLNVTAVSGTSPSMTVKLQDSSDGTNWVDIPSAAFTAATATGTQRLVVSDVGTMVRAVATITGTTPSFTFDLTAVGRS